MALDSRMWCGARAAGGPAHAPLVHLRDEHRVLPAPVPHHWQTSEMQSFMGRSIQLLKEVGARRDVGLTPRGYLYLSASHEAGEQMRASAAGSGGRVDFYDGRALRAQWPFLTTAAVAGMHVRRAGWLDAQAFGSALLEEARTAGAVLERGTVSRVVSDEGGGVCAVRVAREGGAEEEVQCGHFVNAAGLWLGSVFRSAMPPAALRALPQLLVQNEKNCTRRWSCGT